MRKFIFCVFFALLTGYVVYGIVPQGMTVSGAIASVGSLPAKETVVIVIAGLVIIYGLASLATFILAELLTGTIFIAGVIGGLATNATETAWEKIERTRAWKTIESKVVNKPVFRYTALVLAIALLLCGVIGMIVSSRQSAKIPPINYVVKNKADSKIAGALAGLNRTKGKMAVKTMKTR